MLLKNATQIQLNCFFYLQNIATETRAGLLFRIRILTFYDSSFCPGLIPISPNVVISPWKVKGLLNDIRSQEQRQQCWTGPQKQGAPHVCSSAGATAVATIIISPLITVSTFQTKKSLKVRDHPAVALHVS